MNTRLQVEHPVSEMITGQDLVEWQLRVASGEALPLRQDQLRIQGHAMEARLYAENPATGFLPSTGKLEHFRLPEPTTELLPSGDEAAVRVDSAVEQGGEVSVFYDPMISKLIVWAPTREEAAASLAVACEQVEVWPVKTNAAFLARCLLHADFVRGDVDTGFIPARLEALAATPEPSETTVARAFDRLVSRELWRSPGPDQLSGFRLNAAPRAPAYLELEGKVLVRDVADRMRESWADFLEEDDFELPIFENGEAYAFSEPDYAVSHAGAEGDGAVTAPMPGRVVSVDVQAGQAVAKGAKLLTLEAMKMEHGLTAPFNGVVAEVNAEAGAQVSEGTVLVRVEESA
jgi:propionyl-CoA carboxylase alpha chain/3-methylcrotonyl-CoA carboxylase alpha subunit